MSELQVNPQLSHRAELLRMISDVNQATIGTSLTIANTLLGARSEVDVDGTMKTAVELTDSTFSNDKCTVNYNRLALVDYIPEMTADAGDFDWYAPDEWVPETSPAQAVEAFKVAVERAGISFDNQFDSVTVTRRFDDPRNRFVLDYAISSFVWKDTFTAVMPRHFSEEITVTDLDGLYFTPIAAASVVE